MEQKFDGTPRATVRLEGRRATRSDVAGDWGLQLVWSVRKDGKEVATVNARSHPAYEHPDTSAGKYELVLRMFKYVDYKKTPAGEYTASKFVDVSDAVSYTI